MRRLLVVFGEQFKTAGERDAYLQGLADGDGWFFYNTEIPEGDYDE